MNDPLEGRGNAIKDIFDDLFSLLEALETQNIAVLQFLQDENIAPEKKLAHYIERAGNASSVKWRAARVRMEHLLAPIPAAVQDQRKDDPQKTQASDTREEPGDQKRGGRRDTQPTGTSNPITGAAPTHSKEAPPDGKAQQLPEPEQQNRKEFQNAAPKPEPPREEANPREIADRGADSRTSTGAASSDRR
jgi:hypothetical protein